MHIGKTIKLLRVAVELKQKELAKKLGISTNYLSAVENNKREPSFSLLKALSKELNVPVSFLFIESMDEFKNVPKEEREKYQRLKDLLFEIQKLRMNHARS